MILTSRRSDLNYSCESSQATATIGHGHQIAKRILRDTNVAKPSVVASGIFCGKTVTNAGSAGDSLIGYDGPAIGGRPRVDEP